MGRFKMRIPLILLSSLGTSLAYWQPGHEYVYEETGLQNSGTMEFNPSAAGLAWRANTRIQVWKDRLTVQVSDLQLSQYTGDYPTDHSAWKNTTFQPAAAGQSFEYAVNYKNGQIVSVEIPSSLPVHQRNQIKAAASQLQISEEAKTSQYFESKERTLHGECNVHYSSVNGLITRSMVHQKDCRNRPYRFIDNWRGWRCDGNWADEAFMLNGKFMDGRNDPDPISSKSDSYYILGEMNGVDAVLEMGVESGIGTRFFGEKGASKFIYTKRNLKLKELKSSDESINPSGLQTYNDLSFEMDNSVQWNVDRNLKSQEDLFSSGGLIDNNQNLLMNTLKGFFDSVFDNFNVKDASKENVEMLHKSAISGALPYMYRMDYNSLDSIFSEYRSDSSTSGTMKRNLFLGLLSTTGTTASAVLIKDSIMKGHIESSFDAARALTGIPYHIRKPNTQLVRELETLENSDLDTSVQMALQLSMAHLVRRTCELAGKNFNSQEFHQCIKEFSNSYADKYYEKFVNSDSTEEKLMALSALQNLRWGKTKDLLRSFITTGSDDVLQAEAVTAAMYGTFMDQSTAGYFLPVIMNRRLGHETRINALLAFTYGKFDVTQFSSLVNFLYSEQNYEVINFAYSLFKKMSETIDPCFTEKRDIVSYFWRYIEQVGIHSLSYGLGHSKTFRQEFKKDEYQYMASNDIIVIGSEKSMSPLRLSLGLTSTYYKGYNMQPLRITLRIQGLAKSLYKKIRKMPEGDWKLENLAKMLTDMGVQLKEDDPVKIQVLVHLKGDIILNKMYFEDPTKPGSELYEVIKDFQGSSGGNEYNLNKQLFLMHGMNLYEQPTDLGTPMFYASSMATMGSIQATIKKGIARGVLFRDITYDIHLFTHGMDILSFLTLENKLRYSLRQNRVYMLHIPRQLTVGINLVKRELKIGIKQPKQDNPIFMVMHARTHVEILPLETGQNSELAKYCPSCAESHIITKGDDNVKAKSIADKDDTETGTLAKGEYFDCEADLSDAVTGGSVVYLFHPQNKSPKTFMTSLLMGLRQARKFLLNYPKVQKCGIYMQLSQSKSKPVHEIEISLMGVVDNKGSKYIYDGRKLLIKSSVILKGSPEERKFKFNLKYAASPGFVKNEVRAMFSRVPNPALGLTDYVVCFSADNQYPELPRALFDIDLDEQLALVGKMGFRYGATASCGSALGVIDLKFKHETTPESKQSLQEKDYYKKCMNEKQMPEWKYRRGLPITKSCYTTSVDSALARKYSYDVRFESISPEVESILEKGEAVLKTSVLPYWDIDPLSLDRSIKQNPLLKLDILFKGNDKLVDVKLETNKGISNFEDMPVDFSIFSGSLRNLRTDTLGSFFLSNNLAGMCVVTSSYINTLDNATINYAPEECWALVSSHCSPNPTYAVFTKKNGKLPLSMKVYMGGHKVEFNPLNKQQIKIVVNDSPFQVNDGERKMYKKGSSEIFRITNYGGSYFISNELTVAIIYDGNFIEVLPLAVVNGQHCGICGNFDGNKYNELQDKVGKPINSQELSTAWCK